MCLVVFQKIFRKIFSGVWKRRRKTQPRKNSNTVQILPLGSLAGARDRDQQRDLAVARSRSTARSREGEIAIYRSSSRISRSSSTDLPLGSLAGAISRRRDRDQRLDLAKARSRSTDLPFGSHDLPRRIFLSDRSPARSRKGEIAINDAILPSRDRVRRISSRARARSLSLSLIFRKCFEGKIEV